MRRPTFGTIRTEGGLFPPDFLQRLGAGLTDIPGLRPEDYHLAGREKLNEAVSRSWNRLTGIWGAFRTALETLPAGERATSITREKWLLPLFAELGYGRLQSARALMGGDAKFAVSHAWQNVPIHLVGCSIKLDERTAGVAGAARTSPHGLIQEYLNGHAQSQWGIVSNGLTLRLLRAKRTLTRQAYVEFDLAAMMDGQAFSDFALLWLLCHQSRFETEAADAPPTTAPVPDAGAPDSPGETSPEAAPHATCWLERWATLVREQGTRALEELRTGVEDAIKALGSGFLRHPDNRCLLEKLRSGELDRQDYYRQLLRLVYRLIFLFVAEARDLLVVASPNSGPAQHYRSYYSISRLRDLAAARRGTAHGDLWRAFQIVVRSLSCSSGCPELGLPALGGMLWSPAAAPGLDASELANSDLLNAIRALGFRIEHGLRRTVDWRNLGAEELGSVYESLLELRPEVNATAASFELKAVPGHERKTTGSYYTPTSLVECLLDSALDPVLNEAVKKPDPEHAILRLRICDPACGSGHFLIAAAYRVAHRLASVRTGDTEASPEAVRRALRDVIGHCLYGVDINPMAVELCKVNLWLEALEPGRPLSFLDSHIQSGNALLGATPALLKGGIPDAAFEPIEGDDREWCKLLKRANKKERAGQRPLFADLPWMHLGDVSAQIDSLERIDDSTVEGVRQKENLYAELVHSADYEHGHLWADAWCAAFVWPKLRDVSSITEDVFRVIERNPMIAPEPFRREIRRVAEEYRFFHWHLAFPDVFRVSTANEAPPDSPGWDGGFDVVLGNPPWERVKLQEKEWFAERRPDIATAPNAATRKKLIKRVEGEDQSLWVAWKRAQRTSEAESALVRSSGRYPLCGRGDINTYSIFAELNRSLLNPRGMAGFIVPSGIATDDTTKFFFQDLVEKQSLVSLFDFENRNAIFSSVHRSYKFCLLTLAGTGLKIPAAEFAFFCLHPSNLDHHERRFTLGSADFALLNPNTRTCPIFRSRHDAELTKAIYRRVPVLVDDARGDAGNPWGVSFQAMFHMSGDSDLFRTRDPLEADGWQLRGNIFERGGERYLPLYEAKMVHQFDHRFGDYADKDPHDEGTALPLVRDSRLADPAYSVLPRYWVPESAVEGRLRGRWNRGWLLGWRDICRSTDERTVIASVVPATGVGDKFLLMFPNQPSDGALIVGALNSMVFDYCARQKVGGTSLKYFTMRQLPIIAPSFDLPSPWDQVHTIREWVAGRIVELIYTADGVQAFGRDIGWDGPPFRWDSERRFLIRSELHAAFFHLYLPCDKDGSWLPAPGESAEELELLKASFPIPRDAASYIMDTFRIVRRKDEAAFGEYRTKRVILEIYDAMAEAMRTGLPYQTRLDPPPADPRVAHPLTALIAAPSPLPSILPVPPLYHVPARDWALPPNLSPEAFTMAALTEVLYRIGPNADPRDVWRAVQFVRTPAMAIAFLEGPEARQWARAIGPETNLTPGNVVSIAQFQQNSADLLWGDAVAKLKGMGALLESDGLWSIGAPVMTPDDQGWLAGRAEHAVKLAVKLAKDEATVEPKLVAFLKGVHDGAAAANVS